jgi:hypothetical protein
LKSKYSETESILFLKAHHSLSDGFGIFTWLMNLQDSVSKDQIPVMRQISYFQKAVLYMSIPFYVITQGVTMLLRTPDYNPIQNGKALSGKKVASVTKEYNL